MVTVKNRFKKGLRCGRQTVASREVTRERRGVCREREELLCQVSVNKLEWGVENGGPYIRIRARG